MVRMNVKYPNHPQLSKGVRDVIDNGFQEQRNRIRLLEIREHSWVTSHWPLDKQGPNVLGNTKTPEDEDVLKRASRGRPPGGKETSQSDQSVDRSASASKYDMSRTLSRTRPTHPSLLVAIQYAEKCVTLENNEKRVVLPASLRRRPTRHTVNWFNSQYSIRNSQYSFQFNYSL